LFFNTMLIYIDDEVLRAVHCGYVEPSV
jgi:hypothetical protein